MSSESNGNGVFRNGRAAVIGWASGVGGGFLGIIVMLINWHIAPLEERLEAADKTIVKLEAHITKIEDELSRIAGIGAERGVTIPRLGADLQRLEIRLERLEQNQRAPQR